MTRFTSTEPGERIHPITDFWCDDEHLLVSSVERTADGWIAIAWTRATVDIDGEHWDGESMVRVPLTRRLLISDAR